MKPLVTFLGAVGLVAIIVIINNIADLQRSESTVDSAIASERKQLLEQVDGKQAYMADTYGWVDKEKGIVRIPISRAMSITVKSLQEK